MEVLLKKTIAALVAGSLAFSAIPAFAESDTDMSITVTDAVETSDDTTSDNNAEPIRSSCANLLGTERRSCILNLRRAKLQRKRLIIRNRFQNVRSSVRTRLKNVRGTARKRLQELRNNTRLRRLQSRTRDKELTEAEKSNRKSLKDLRRNRRNALRGTQRTNREKFRTLRRERMRQLRDRQATITVDETGTTGTGSTSTDGE